MYKVKILNAETKEIRESTIDLIWDEASYFRWEEGNMSCDCNRHRLFYKSHEDGKCGDGLFEVNIYDKEGKLLYQEFEEAT